MLVLSRRIGEQLIIGDNIVITINRVAGQRVSVGIEAPPQVRIVRRELEHEQAPGGRPPATSAA